MHITHRIIKVLIKSSGLMKCCCFCFFMVGFKKLCCITKMVCMGTSLKSCKCSCIFRKPFLSVSFLLEMFDLTNCRLFLVIRNVHVVIYIKKYLVYLFRISFFLWIYKDPCNDIFESVGKLCLVLFFRSK